MAEYSQTFQGKGVKLVGLSCDDVPSHLEWIKDIEATATLRETKFPLALLILWGPERR
ncbi:hypothetical protein ACFX19_021906 [Malus domestica]